jgi:iron(III) transport system substrate-binding protein
MIFAGSHSDYAAAADDLIAGAKKEGGLVLYLSTNLTDANGLIQLFKQKYPFINVDFFRADNEKLLNRILTESTTDKFNGDVIMISSFEVGAAAENTFAKI